MKIAEDVLAVLSRVDASAGDKTVRLPEQLARKHYEAVNKVLVELGGKWNRGRKAHLFSEDPESLIEQCLLTGEVGTRAERGFFPTSAELSKRLVAELALLPLSGVGALEGMRVLEPSAGDGDIVEAMLFAGAAEVVVCEIDDKQRAALYSMNRRVAVAAGDFFDMPLLPAFDAVGMNPPFAKDPNGHDAIDHVSRAFRFLKPGGRLASILPSGVRYREDRKHTAFRDWIDSIDGTMVDLPDGSFKAAGTNVSTVLVTVIAP